MFILSKLSVLFDSVPGLGFADEGNRDCWLYYDKEEEADIGQPDCRLRLHISSYRVDCQKGQFLTVMDGLNVKMSFCGASPPERGGQDIPEYLAIGKLMIVFCLGKIRHSWCETTGQGDYH